jgi:hypothetical protein
MLTRTAILSLLVLAVGCASQTRTFDVTVHNNSTKPLTLVLTKDAGPKEAVWTAPEDVNPNDPSSDLRWGIGSVPPGKVAIVSKAQATLPQGGNAFLRIYVGDLSTDAAKRVVPGTSQRLDLQLQPGTNDFVIVSKEDGVAVESAADATTQPAAAPAPTQPETAPAVQPPAEPPAATTPPAAPATQPATGPAASSAPDTELRRPNELVPRS